MLPERPNATDAYSEFPGTVGIRWFRFHMTFFLFYRPPLRRRQPIFGVRRLDAAFVAARQAGPLKKRSRLWRDKGQVHHASGVARALQNAINFLS